MSGRSVLITGALGGIGRACAKRFANEGAQLTLVDRLSDSGSDFAAALLELGACGASFFSCDVANEQDVARCCETMACEYGFDVLVNVAGRMTYAPIESMTGELWKRVLDVNFLGAAYFTTEAFRWMESGGSIVNVASIHASRTSPQVAAYAAAKAAMVSLTRSAAIEGEPKGIRANCLLPGAIDTPMLRESPNIKSGIEKLDPRDIGMPEDVAAAAAFLASEDACFITGASLRVDGGRLARL